ncbi:unnamed protein product [Zymoseptoria tritici ST99CH_3D7]|uniref:Uncharacterized protein n=1 Tax=Zymoseptoria tritici (strain ST99CH_3D7) TaxID=1276538 RepID=A0A1X7RDM2_ZYMT9|nr:unnamed protein product [Zymoseptoria tritici ST99CH_3D7]
MWSRIADTCVYAPGSRFGRLPRVKGNSVNNGPHLEIELLGWVHSYNSVTVPRIRLTKFFGRLCFVLARAGFLKGTVNITLAGYGSTFAPRRGPPLATSQAAVRHLQRHLYWHLVAEQERMKAERKRKDEWEKKLELMMEAQKTEKDAVEN